MSWPKTSTRPSSRVSSPQMSRMSVDLPEPLAPRIPWMSPRSRRIDTCEIAVTGGFFRPTTNRLLTSSMRRAGGPPVGGRPGRPGRRGDPGAAGPSDRSSVVGSGWWSLETPGLRGRGGGPEMTKSRGSDPTVASVGLAALVSRPAGGAGKGIKKAGGPIWPTARGSSGRRSCRLRSSSRWAQISRARRRRWAQAQREERRVRHHRSRLLEVDLRPRLASRSGVYSPGSNQCQARVSRMLMG